MPPGLEYSGEDDLSYQITHVRLEFDFTHNISTLVTSTLTYVLDPQHGELDDSIILKGKNLTLIAIFLNGRALNKDIEYTVSPHGHTLTIIQPPAHGVLKIVTINTINALPTKGINQTNGIINIYSIGRDIEFITYFAKRSDTLASYTTEIIYDPNIVNLTRARGKLDSIQAEGNMVRAIWSETTPKSCTGFYLLAGKFYCAEADYVSINCDRTIHIVFFTISDHIKTADLYVAYMRQVMLWYEQTFHTLCNQEVYEIIAAPFANPETKLTLDLNVFSADKLFIELSDHTDEQYLHTLGKFFWNFFDTLANESSRESTTKNLTRIYMDHLYGYSRSRILTLQSYPDRLTDLEWVQNICENDPYASKWLEIQSLYYEEFAKLADCIHNSQIAEMPCGLINTFRDILQNQSYQLGFKADILTLPKIDNLEKLYVFFDSKCIRKAFAEIESALSNLLEESWYKTYKIIRRLKLDDKSPASAGTTRLKNLCLYYLSKCKNPKYLPLINQSRYSPRMSERSAGNSAYETLYRSVSLMSASLSTASYHSEEESEGDMDDAFSLSLFNQKRLTDTRLEIFKATGIYATSADSVDWNISKRRLSL